MGKQESTIYMARFPLTHTETYKLQYLPARLEPFAITRTSWEDFYASMVNIATKNVERTKTAFETAEKHLAAVKQMKESDCIMPEKGYIST